LGTWNYVPVPIQPLTRKESINRVCWVALLLLASVTMVVVGFLLGLLLAFWMY
jgi:hypothetical protein